MIGLAFALSNRISDLILSTSGELVCSYLSEDRLLLHAARTNPSVLFTTGVPGSVGVLRTGRTRTGFVGRRKTACKLHRKIKTTSRVILYRASSKLLFIVADTMRKCRDIEQVLKAHVMTLISASMPNVQFLSDDELIFHLMNWEAEKYKRSV